MGEHFNFLDDPTTKSQLTQLLETHLDALSSFSKGEQYMTQAFAALEADKWFRHMLSTASNKDLEGIATQLALGEYAKKPSSDAAYEVVVASNDIAIAAVKGHTIDEKQVKFDSKIQEFYLSKLLELRARAREIAGTPSDTKDIN